MDSTEGCQRWCEKMTMSPRRRCFLYFHWLPWLEDSSAALRVWKNCPENWRKLRFGTQVVEVIRSINMSRACVEWVCEWCFTKFQSSFTKSEEDFRDQSVLIVGGRSSAVDVARELRRRLALRPKSGCSDPGDVILFWKTPNTYIDRYIHIIIDIYILIDT